MEKDNQGFKYLLIPQRNFLRWMEIIAVFIGIANLILVTFIVIKTKTEQEKYLSNFLKNSDFISVIVFEQWGVFLLIALCGFILGWFIYKTNTLPKLYGLAITFVYILCAMWMTFSAISAMTNLAKFANA